MDDIPTKTLIKAFIADMDPTKKLIFKVFIAVVLLILILLVYVWFWLKIFGHLIYKGGAWVLVLRTLKQQRFR